MEVIDTTSIHNNFIKELDNRRLESRVEELAHIISILEKRIEKLEKPRR